MGKSLNKIILRGHLGQDPELKQWDNGDKSVKFSLATTETWTDKKSGDKKEKTQWHNIVVQNQHLADIASNYAKKGSFVGLEGALEYRKYEKDGISFTTAEVILSRFKGELDILTSKEEQPWSLGCDTPTPQPVSAKPYVAPVTPRQAYPNEKRAFQAPPAAAQHAPMMDDEVPF